MPRGIDPIIDEGILAHSLHFGAYSTQQFRQMFAVALLAAYDRKVTRDFMAEFLQAACDADQALHDLGEIVAVTIQKQTPANRKKIAQGVQVKLENPQMAAAQAKFVALKGKFADLFSKVAQCANSTDTIS